MTTSAQRDDNRLTESDRLQMARAVGIFAAATLARTERGAWIAAAERVAAHAIGCGLYDLRASELAELAELVATRADAAN